MTDKEIVREIRKWAAAIIRAMDALDYMGRVTSLPDCNTCGRDGCTHIPDPGEWTRINCYDWREKNEGKR